MATMIDFGRDDYRTLLAGSVVDATNGALFQSAALLAPNTTHRTILIGLGGTGIQTLDYIKGVISKRLQPNWPSYIAFLGIDTNKNEIDQAKYLTPGECVETTLTGGNTRKDNKNSWPVAWRTFANEDALAGIVDMQTSGASRQRLVGRLKIHDKDDSGAVDMNIVTKLTLIKNNLAGFTATGSMYEVYVIGSVGGGTCSGGLAELPALIHKGLANPARTHIYSMLYLPDTLTMIDPANAPRIMSNGFAALKELNYYQGIEMRPGYSETWGYNDPAFTTLQIDGGSKFFDIPYLIGAKNGVDANGIRYAKQNIAEFMISLLSKVSVVGGAKFLTDDFISNVLPNKAIKASMVGAPEKEANKWAHEQPRHYATIGFAQAAVPKKIVRAYVVGEACKIAGLKPIDPVKRDQLLAAGTAVLPYRGEDDLYTAKEGTDKAAALMQPLTALLKEIHSARFSFMEASKWASSGMWVRIHKNEHETAAESRKINNAVMSKIDQTAMDALTTKIRTALGDFRNKVKEFVTAEGPFAFYTLYQGRFIVGNDGYEGVGLGKMLSYLKDGKMTNGVAYGWDNPRDRENDLKAAKTALDRADGLFDRISKRDSTAAAWVTAYDNWKKAVIIEARRNHALYDTGKIYELVVRPVAAMAEQIKAFGYVLATLSDIYEAHGQSMNNFANFAVAHDNEAEVNLAAISPNSHKWLLQQAENQIRGVNAKDVREGLVEHFFAGNNAAAWLEIPEGLVDTREDSVRMLKENTAVPAREIFDRVIQESVPDTMSLSIEKTFEALADYGTSYDAFAHDVMEKLAAESAVMFNGDLFEEEYNRYLMYPSTLAASSAGMQIAAAIRNAANLKFNGIQCYESDDTDTIRLYQMAAPFEMYRLRALDTWQNNYAAMLDRTTHGMSPDVKAIYHTGAPVEYEERTMWKDYPSPQYFNPGVDLTLPDPVTGLVSEEGMLRRELRKMIEKAKEMGILYSRKDVAGWNIYRVHCNKAIHWQLDLGIMSMDEEGLLPTGIGLTKEIAEQNGTTLAAISAKVVLKQGGLMEAAHVEEEFAWMYAERVLRAHMPMQFEIRDTLALIEPWYNAIEEENKHRKGRLNPARMVRMIMGKVLYMDATGLWKVKLADGREKPVANLSDRGVRMLKVTNPREAALISNGFSAYYLFNKLSALPEMTDEGFENAVVRAQEWINELSMAGEEEEILKLGDLFAFVETEGEAVAAMDPAPEEAETGAPRTRFLAAMKEKSVAEAETAQAIRMFYSRAAKWADL